MQSIRTLRSFSTQRVAVKIAPSLVRPSLRSISQQTRRPLSRMGTKPVSFLHVSSRLNTTLAVPESEASKRPHRPTEPSYQLTFTCKPCSHRSAHYITKHGYHKGTVLIQCPSCKNRHVISDHLNIFMDQKQTLEDILKAKAGTDADPTKLLKKGKLGMREGELVGHEGDEDIEFWDDGSQTQHTPAHPPTA